MSDEIVLPAVDVNENTPQPESTENYINSKIDSQPKATLINDEVKLLEPELGPVDETVESLGDEATTAIKSSEHDTNLIDIINSMEEDRKKFIAHVHNKIASQDSEFEVKSIFFLFITYFTIVYPVCSKSNPRTSVFAPASSKWSNVCARTTSTSSHPL